MRIAVVSSSLNEGSRSRTLAGMCRSALESQGIRVDFIDLRELDPPNFDDDATTSRLTRALAVLTELSERLDGRSHVSDWEV